MSDADARALGRTALVLLLASAARLAWGGAEGPGGAPTAGEVLPGLVEASRALADDERARSLPLAPGERLDPNTASVVALDRLHGVGPALADAVVRSREEEGPFLRPEDLLRVRGVGPALLARVAPHLDIQAPPGLAQRRAGAAPAPGRPALLDLNRADTVALQALPGVGPALARRIVEERRTAPFRSVDDLERVKGIGPATLERLRPHVTVRP
jgi:competence protein ComEA